MNQTSKKGQQGVRIVVSALLCVLIIIGSVGAMNRMAKTKKPPAVNKAKKRMLSVEAIPVVREPVALSVTGYGEARPVETVEICTEVGGRIIEKTALKQGEIVQKGDLLFRIDPTDYRITRERARIQIDLKKNQINQLEMSYKKDRERLASVKKNAELARSNHLRLKLLYEKSRVGTLASVETAEQNWLSLSDSQRTLEKAIDLYPLQILEARGQLEDAEADFETARLNLERCTVKAPFAGRVKALDFETGVWVATGTTLMTLADDALLEVLVPLSDKDAFNVLGLGRQNLYSSDGSGLKGISCAVEPVTGLAVSGSEGMVHRAVRYDPDTRTLYLAVRVPGKVSSTKRSSIPILDGMFCRVNLTGNIQKSTVKAPVSVLNPDRTVYIVRDGKLKTVATEKIKETGGQVYLSGAFHSDDHLITTKLSNPIENTTVEIVSSRVPGAIDTPGTAEVAAKTRGQS